MIVRGISYPGGFGGQDPQPHVEHPLIVSLIYSQIANGIAPAIESIIGFENCFRNVRYAKYMFNINSL